jgi:hypothetical protein
MWAHQAMAATPSSGYSLARGGLHALMRYLAIELAPAQDPGQCTGPIYERCVPKDKLEQTLHSFDGSMRSAVSAPPWDVDGGTWCQRTDTLAYRGNPKCSR